MCIWTLFHRRFGPIESSENELCKTCTDMGQMRLRESVRVWVCKNTFRVFTVHIHVCLSVPGPCMFNAWYHQKRRKWPPCTPYLIIIFMFIIIAHKMHFIIYWISGRRHASVVRSPPHTYTLGQRGQANSESPTTISKLELTEEHYRW